MQRRGRSSKVSPVALARRASEERLRRTKVPPTPLILPVPSLSTSASSTPSLSYSPDDDDYYESPPSPPKSLQDRMQHAYANDNILLAKTLLLKLKGDSRDPAEVRDEEFDVYFVPQGGLGLDPEVEKQRKKIEEERRLSAVERIWDDGKRSMAIRRREKAKQETAIVSPAGPTRKDSEPFQYSFMPINSARKPSKPLSSPLPVAISFKDVLASMRGPLFPIDPTDQAPISKSRQKHLSRSSAQTSVPLSRNNELLESLLKVVEWDDGERRRAKGKAPDRGFGLKSVPSVSACAACAASLSSTPCTSTAPSRSGSWLSFTSRSSASTSTAATTPSTSPSPISSWLKSPLRPSQSPSKTQPLRHSCLRSSHSFVPVEYGDCPLTSVGSCEVTCQLVQVNTSSFDGGHKGMLTRFLELAKSFQSAYIGATMLSVTVHTHGGSYTPARSKSCSQARTDWQERPIGYRVSRVDVRVFIAIPSGEDEHGIPLSTPVYFIPLASPFPPNPIPLPPSPTAISSKLPYTFPPLPPLTRSPLRPRSPPMVLEWRRRPVANPVALRLRALQTCLAKQGLQWEGIAREGGKGCGRERLIGVAFDGIGRSGLGCEVRLVR